MSDTAIPVLIVVKGLGLTAALAGCCRPIQRHAITDPEAFLRSADGKAVRVIVTLGSFALEDWMWRLPALQLIACASAGYDAIDLVAARSRDIAVSAGRGVNDDDVADLALGLTLALVRQIVPGDRLIRSGEWRRSPALPISRSISQMRCGILGLGAIGSAVARRLMGFGAHLAWWGPNPKPDVPWSRAGSLAELARESDILIVTAPSTPASRGCIDASILTALGPSGYLVNVARGDLVDEHALRAALIEGRLAGAALDVFRVEPDDGCRWADLNNLIVTPHVGAWAARGMEEARRMCVANVCAVLEGKPPLTPIRSAWATT